MKPTNKESAKRIENALAGDDYFLGETVGDGVIDALTDIRHLCDKHKLDFAGLAYSHYVAEVNGE